jgi:hypothetical protein
MREELEEVGGERDRLIAVARGEAEPEEGDDVDDETPAEDRVKKINKDSDRDIKDIEEEYADRKALFQESFDTFVKLSVKTLINDETLYREMKLRFGDYFRGGMGAEAVKDLLAQLDLDALATELRTLIRDGKGQKRQKAIKRLKVVDALLRAAAARVDDSGCRSSDSAGPAPRVSSTTVLRVDLNDLPSCHQPQQPPQAVARAARARDHHPQRAPHAPGGGRRALRQRPPWQDDHGPEQAPAEVAVGHAQGQAGSVPSEPARQARRLLGALGHRGRPAAQAPPVRAAEEDGP